MKLHEIINAVYVNVAGGNPEENHSRIFRNGWENLFEYLMACWSDWAVVADDKTKYQDDGSLLVYDMMNMLNCSYFWLF